MLMLVLIAMNRGGAWLGHGGVVLLHFLIGQPAGPGFRQVAKDEWSRWRFGNQQLSDQWSRFTHIDP